MGSQSILSGTVRFNSNSIVLKQCSCKNSYSLYLMYFSLIVSQAGTGEKMRLIDEAFAKLCHAINDPCVQVCKNFKY